MFLLTCHLAEVASCTLCDLLNLSLLISQTLLFIQFLGEGLQLGESELQGQPVSVGRWRVSQHVLFKTNEKSEQADVNQA